MSSFCLDGSIIHGSYNDILIQDAESVNEVEAILEKDDVLLLLDPEKQVQSVSVYNSSLCVQNTERGAAANEDWHGEYFTFTIFTNV